jgi:hypothetical protein
VPRLVAASRFHADDLRTNHLSRPERLALAPDAGVERVIIVGPEDAGTWACMPDNQTSGYGATPWGGVPAAPRARLTV